MVTYVSTVPRPVPRRIATLSVHTSPLDQPGTGDAGGLNVYVVEVARRLAARGTEVEIFTRAVCRDTPPVTELTPGVLVRSVAAGPFEELDKSDLPGQICPFTFEVLRAEAAHAPGRYDLIHAHYWLSGQVGAVARERWGVPLVQSMHTLGRVKNAALADGDTAEPDSRIRGEHEVVAAADRLIANTPQEARQLTELYGADPAKIRTVSPGADLTVFRPGSALLARRKLGLAPDAVVLVFAGRVQPLKGPDIVLRAAARLLAEEPALAGRLTVAMVGGPSGAERSDPDRMRVLAAALGISGAVRLEPPCPQAELADWYRAATVVLAPSHSESFGLVALEAQACGTPVVAARVGGLRTAVRDGYSGVLVEGHDPADYARAVRELIAEPRRLASLSAGAPRHASAFGWSATVDRLSAVYTGAMEEATARVEA
ncbi:MAG: D-inositol-3-phosphate glycosyltransferase [Streptosporangiaceae bacterium]|nr:D-inositol-3-phosphate glycosyltransferase [Streptosporangiaceae bacterium]